MKEKKSVLKIDSLTKSYAQSQGFVLEDLSLEIPRGSLTAIIGRNGAGKSTLFNCIAGLVEFQQGIIQIEFNDGTHLELTPGGAGFKRRLRRRIGMVFQDASLWPHLTVLENVAKPLIDIYECQREEAESRAREWLLVKLKVQQSELGKFPRQLSGGQQKRVALARTFVINPEILLIDEFEANLDPEAVEIVLRLVEENFIQDANRTVLMVTHRIDFLTRCASRVIVLDGGRLIEQGPPDKVLENPDPHTASFIREVIDPSRSQWTFLNRCLESSIRITSLALSQDSEGTIFQHLAMEVLKLIEQLEPHSPHLVLMVAKDSGQPFKLSIRGACKSQDFILDGSEVHYLDELVVPEEVLLTYGNQQEVKSYCFAAEYEKLMFGEYGVLFDAGGSLIAKMMMAKKKLAYLYADTYPPILGPYHVSIPPSDAAITYYQLSTKTQSVYLFPMEWEGSTVGVLSIDTYSSEKWLPFVVKQLVVIANLGALSIKIYQNRNRLSSTEESLADNS